MKLIGLFLLSVIWSVEAQMMMINVVSIETVDSSSEEDSIEYESYTRHNDLDNDDEDNSHFTFPSNDYEYANDENFDDDINATAVTIHVEAPSPTNWTFTINGTIVDSGTEDFCDPDPTTYGGMAVMMLRTALRMEEMECPLKTKIKEEEIKSQWEEDMPLDDMFGDGSTSMVGVVNIETPFIKSRIKLSN